MKSILLDVIANLEIPGCTVKPAGETHYGEADNYSRTDFIVMDKDKNILRVCVVDINEREGDRVTIGQIDKDERPDRKSKDNVRRIRRPIERVEKKSPRRVRMQGFGFDEENAQKPGQRSGENGKSIRRRHNRP